MGYKLYLAASVLLLISILVFVGHARSVTPLPEAKDQNQNQNQLSQVLPILNAVGPESFAFDKDGDGPYTGVSDGRIIKWLGNESRWINFAVTTSNRTGCEGSYDHVETEPICGRTLGLSFNKKTGDLYIADAYMGLLVVGSKGGLATPLTKEAQGIPFNFTNGVIVDQSTGIVYFTDSSTTLQRREYAFLILSGDKSGRLLKFDPKTNKVTVLLDNLMFPNGVALSKKGDFLIVAETTNCRILRYWLEPSKAGRVEVFADLPGFPDNVKRNQKGEFWVAINPRKEKFMAWILSHSRLANVLTKLPFEFTSAHSLLGDSKGYGLAVKLSENGDLLQTLEDKEGETWKYSSEVDEENGYLWIGSVQISYAVKLKMSS